MLLNAVHILLDMENSSAENTPLFDFLFNSCIIFVFFVGNDIAGQAVFGLDNQLRPSHCKELFFCMSILFSGWPRLQDWQLKDGRFGGSSRFRRSIFSQMILGFEPYSFVGGGSDTDVNFIATLSSLVPEGAIAVFAEKHVNYVTGFF
ncbi:hypothetical protein DINM_003569 [Dirofilaria immitis]|nr:hypothetical protein [Dirofilaria immitis]